MKAAVRIPRADKSALEFLSVLARVFSDYGIEIAHVASDAGEPVRDADYTVVFGEGEDAHDVLYLARFSEEDAVGAAERMVGHRYFETVALYGIDAETARARCKEVGKRNIAVTVSESRSGLFVRVRYGERAAKVDVDAAVDALKTKFADCMYADSALELEEFIVARLLQTKRRIALAESFTGGGVTARLTAVPGASRAVTEGIVAYTEKSKIDRLGVSARTIAFDTAVSVNTAYQMAAGLLSGGAEIAVATTGYAGPDGSDVGKCYIAVGDARRINIFEYRFGGTRREITDRGVRAALERIADYLLDKNLAT